MDDVTRVEWREWGESAFDAAAAADRPVLLSLTATWCSHCHEMDAETYADPTIAANVTDGFVPVRVDVDRRPRVRDRYNMGGFPSTVFLAPDGSVLTGAGYLGPDGMRQAMESVRTMWERKGAGAGRIPRPLRADDPPAGALTDDIEGAMLARLEGAYDEVAGGWGDGPKFPLPDALEFALKRDREMALRSFDAVGANLLDAHEGGFYRFATERDWSGIQHEKLLDANAALVRAFASAYLHTGRDEYREPAARTIEYLTTTLWLSGDETPVDDGSGAFAGSQPPGDPEGYTLEASDREAAADPSVDDTVFAGSNGLAVEALCTYAAYTDAERARRYAERALETLREGFLEEGVAVHHRAHGAGEDGDGTGVERDRADGDGPLLATQARVLGALTSARSVLGPSGGRGSGGEDRGADDELLADARAVADAAIDRLREGDSFLDGPATGAGLVARPLRPLDANVELADALIDLAVLTGDDRYRAVAREAIADFAGASDRLGVQVARYAAVAARLLDDPLVVRVGSPAGSDLHRAALRVADHEKVVVPAAAALEAGTARVERGDRESAIAETPDEVSGRVRSLLE